MKSLLALPSLFLTASALFVACNTPSPSPTEQRRMASSPAPQVLHSDRSSPRHVEKESLPAVRNHRLIFTSQNPVFSPRLSPDGLFLAFSGPKFEQVFFLSLPDARLAAGPMGQGVGWRLEWNSNTSLLMRSPGGLVFQTDVGSGATALLATLSPPSTTTISPITGASYFQHQDHIWAESTDGTRLQLTPLHSRAFDPLLSPDASLLVWSDLASGIWLRNLRTNADVNVGEGVHPVFDADSAWLLFNRSQDDGLRLTASELFAFRISSATVSQLTFTDDCSESWPAPSADGKSLVYACDRELWMADLDLP